MHPITALQTEYSLWSRDAEGQILPLCRELGVGYAAYSPGAAQGTRYPAAQLARLNG